MPRISRVRCSAGSGLRSVASRRQLRANSRSRSERQTCALAQGKLIARTPLGVPQIEPEAVVPADEARMVSGATHDVTTGDSANYAA